MRCAAPNVDKGWKCSKGETTQPHAAAGYATCQPLLAYTRHGDRRGILSRERHVTDFDHLVIDTLVDDSKEASATHKCLPYPAHCRPRYPCSNTFVFSSTTFFTSLCPLSTTFSINAFAFFKSSGLAAFASSNARSFFCCFARPSRTVDAALSPALAASSTAALRDSAVGGGIFRMRRSGLWPDGSGWGVRERVEDWMAEEMGLTCCNRPRVSPCFQEQYASVDAHLSRQR